MRDPSKKKFKGVEKSFSMMEENVDKVLVIFDNFTWRCYRDPQSADVLSLCHQRGHVPAILFEVGLYLFPDIVMNEYGEIGEHEKVLWCDMVRSANVVMAFMMATALDAKAGIFVVAGSPPGEWCSLFVVLGTYVNV